MSPCPTWSVRGIPSNRRRRLLSWEVSAGAATEGSRVASGPYTNRSRKVYAPT